MQRGDGRTEFSSLYRVCITCSAVKTSKKFKKDISFVFSLLYLHCFTIQQSIQYCSNPTIKQEIEVLVRLMLAVNLSIIS